MIDVLGPEKRRRRTTQEKIAIVQQSFEPGMTVSLVARQHGVAASQLFLWRKQYRKEVLLLSPPENRLFLPLNLLPP
ncbi:transposase [Escherichia coli]|uniref:transposase n=1 Tax=Escherichia coli TaxID=562 RepID=UPI000F0FDF8A|nr:transposase [Escherichia coli]MDC9092769.1 transposase [Escherichia coli]VCV56575.1 Putative transposase (identified by ISEscan HMM) [Escherichia coli]VCZ23954.1 Putative transposase (identified by ISEscan HMM) [Escherichia coli]